MKFTVKTQIFADKMTKNGNVYPEEVLRKAIKEFNERGGVKCGPVDRDVLSTRKYTHITHSARLTEDKEVEFECETMENRDGKYLEQVINNDKISFLPIIEAPLDQPIEKDGVKVITRINNIKGIGVCYDKSKQDYRRNSEK